MATVAFPLNILFMFKMNRVLLYKCEKTINFAGKVAIVKDPLKLHMIPADVFSNGSEELFKFGITRKYEHPASVKMHAWFERMCIGTRANHGWLKGQD